MTRGHGTGTLRVPSTSEPTIELAGDLGHASSQKA
ncbi:uncharacterized protein METZ01_LOCUS245318 [marine metagenome]|uniref:Uncharacterized protein n=1 Tax=marine metagenome TaxID=408172 RepID=A0A382HYH9_9ZZZZ